MGGTIGYRETKELFFLVPPAIDNLRSSSCSGRTNALSDNEFRRMRATSLSVSGCC